jgi:Ser/Thr protein kinase RdoA (MazF antagonist)
MASHVEDLPESAPTVTTHAALRGVREEDRPSRVGFGRLLRRGLHRDDLEVSACRPLSRNVYQLTLTTARPASVVMKRLDPAAAHRDRLLARRWLPAVGLAHAGPPLLATVSDQEESAAWSVYEWLDSTMWGPIQSEPDNLNRLVDVVASMHVRFAGHPLMAEVRHFGAHLGHGVYASQLDDARVALAAARRAAAARAHLEDALLIDLERAVCSAREAAPALLTLLRDVGGPDTLLHGDLWPQNVVAGRGRLRLIDWDRLGVGPVIYDLSTLLLRLSSAARQQVLEQYLAQIVAAGWPLPTVDELIFLSTALERGRLATLISWRVLDLLQAPDDAVASWAAGELRAIGTWWTQVDPRPEIPEAELP